MRSSTRQQIQAVIDVLTAAVSSYERHFYQALTPSELVDVLEEGAFLVGQLDALMYELRSPFARPRGRWT
ncbi:hypothetical protein [Mycobacterium sp. E2479]|uniref:hypothetical protein n=1 Tax=Mycobacterium sp. E2479 TaxID=1834134 RepID=UPI0007FF5524|nr:hypothetical protein [Mycobacterium sp. E2479]OBH60591.1 hypothetical protein A5686_21010 [Mycobacterium sp. E2479]